MTGPSPDLDQLVYAPEGGQPCEACYGTGQWESECCDGSCGCTCRGMRVPMGTCNVCGGAGWVQGAYRPAANVKAIWGLCYLGSGPR